MLFTKSKLPGIVLLEPEVFSDSRGFFLESYNQFEANSNGINFTFVQDNQSHSINPGVLRGLHYQLNPNAQTKLIRVTSGAIYDVVVDIRLGSPTFGEWQGCILSAYNYRQLLIPAGFAHGFCTLVPNTVVQYKVDVFYLPEYERGIAWDDPSLAIEWPTHSPILSEKDKNLPSLKEADNNYVF